MRKATTNLVAGAALLTLAGCGSDGAGSVASVSTPPTNASLANLVASQSFANNAASQTAQFDLTTGTTTSGSSTSQPLTFSYDAASNSYAVSTQGRSQTFAPAAIASQANGSAQYKVTNGTTTDYLTVESASISGFPANSPKYSGLAYWQHNTVTGTTQDTTFDIFTYGINSAASAIPRSGQAAYATSIIGLSTQPGVAPGLFQGTGRLDVDFLDGVFTTTGVTSETNLVTGTTIGGASSIYGQGTLSSSTNALTGTIQVYGSSAHSSGALAGQFYGPAAQELGLAFSTTGADGSATSGAIWGIGNPGLTPTNLSLTNLVANQRFYTPAVQMDINQTSSGQYFTSLNPGTGTLDITPAGAYTVGGVGSDLPSTTFTSADKVTASSPNFTSYQQTFGTGMLQFDLYKPGAANTELQLTYLSFGRWQGPQSTINPGNIVEYFVYGMPTQAIATSARTGTAKYTGVAYGTAYSASTNTSASVNGTAAFTMDFARGGYTGSFGLKNTATDYGTFNVSGTIANGYAGQGSVTGTQAGTGQINPAFYGPNGQEFGGAFQISVPAAMTTIVGAVVAKGG